MISKHVQDPIKAWGREKHLYPVASHLSTVVVEVQKFQELAACSKPKPTVLTYEGTNDVEPLHERISSLVPADIVPDPRNISWCIGIYFCSMGTVAEKLATKLHQWTKSHKERFVDVSLNPEIQPLNRLEAIDLSANKIFLIIVSSTGQGEIPMNGLAFEERCRDLLAITLSPGSKGFRFAVFGNGDSRYSSTYNGGADKIHSLMRQMGGVQLMQGIWHGDTAAEPIPLRSLNSWWAKLQPSMDDVLTASVDAPVEEDKLADDAIQKYSSQHSELISTLKDGLLVKVIPEVGTEVNRSLLISLNIGSEPFAEMSCIQILPCNAPTKVEEAVRALCVDGSTNMNLVFDDGDDPTFSKFLTEYVDLERPFIELEWLKSVRLATQKNITVKSLSQLSVFEVLCRLIGANFTEDRTSDYCLQRDICLDMPLLSIKTYSVASHPRYALTREGDSRATGHEVDIMAKVYHDGRFSDKFLHSFVTTPAPLKYRFVDSRTGPELRNKHLAPFVIVATGAGFGPVRCLLQWRIATAREAIATGQPPPQQGKGISLYLGLKACDQPLIEDILDEAK